MTRMFSMPTIGETVEPTAAINDNAASSLIADNLPSFAELIAPYPPGVDENVLCPEGIKAAKAWLARLDREIARVKADHQAGNVRFKFDTRAIYDERHADRAYRNNIDYVGIALLYNEKYEHNPITQHSRREGASWFSDRYRTAAQMRNSIGAMLQQIAFIKRQLAAHSER